MLFQVPLLLYYELALLGHQLVGGRELADRRAVHGGLQRIPLLQLVLVPHRLPLIRFLILNRREVAGCILIHGLVVYSVGRGLVSSICLFLFGKALVERLLVGIERLVEVLRLQCLVLALGIIDEANMGQRILVLVVCICMRRLSHVHDVRHSAGYYLLLHLPVLPRKDLVLFGEVD